jgi:hypothetical protein
MKYIFLYFVISYFFIINSFGQSVSPTVISPIGNFNKNSSSSLSWTFGEPVIQTLKNSGNSLTQGFQQPRYQLNSIDEIKSSNYEISIYPNPTADFININFNITTVNQLYTEIINPVGEKLLSKRISLSDNKIDLSNFNSNFLLLRIFDIKGSNIKTYKVIKINN